ncbi:MAG: hypothetical protein KY475_18800 [Planctomycetes bacterium]|nr:hypothetical protein [Planctomycetota bacterium]
MIQRKCPVCPWMGYGFGSGGLSESKSLSAQRVGRERWRRRRRRRTSRCGHGRQELDENLRFARSYKPLSEDEKPELLARGKKLAGEWGTPYGPVT